MLTIALRLIYFNFFLVCRPSIIHANIISDLVPLLLWMTIVATETSTQRVDCQTQTNGSIDPDLFRYSTNSLPLRSVKSARTQRSAPRPLTTSRSVRIRFLVVKVGKERTVLRSSSTW